jgi:glycine cleavage system regulatory protein
VQQFKFGGGTSFGALSAVAHRFTLVVPSAEIEAVQEKNSAACVKHGCNILSSSIDRSDRGSVSASMSIRIKPDAYDAFAAALAAPPARIRNHSQTADDLAAPVLDIEKRMATKTTLRERLTALLNDQNTKTAADMIDIEKELSQAQGEIENLTAQLENLRKRTDMVSVDITYIGATGGFGGFDLEPLHEAVMGIGQTVVRSLAMLVYCLAAVGPWLPLVAIVWWIIRRSVWRRRSSQSVTSSV